MKTVVGKCRVHAPSRPADRRVRQHLGRDTHALPVPVSAAQRAPGAGGPQRSGHQHRLEEQPRETVLIGVQPKVEISFDLPLLACGVGVNRNMKGCNRQSVRGERDVFRAEGALVTPSPHYRSVHARRPPGNWPGHGWAPGLARCATAAGHRGDAWRVWPWLYGKPHVLRSDTTDDGQRLDAGV